MNRRTLLLPAALLCVGCRAASDTPAAPAGDVAPGQVDPIDTGSEATDTGGGADLPAPTLLSYDDATGVLVRTDQPDTRLELRPPGGSWQAAPGVAGKALAADAWYWLADDELPTEPESVEGRLVSATRSSVATTPAIMGPSLDLGDPVTPLIATDQIHAVVDGFSLLAGQAGQVGLRVTLNHADAPREGWITDACAAEPLDTCLSTDPLTWPVTDLGAATTLATWTAEHAEPAVLQLDAFLWVTATGSDGTEISVPAIKASGAALPSTGRRGFWGDLHAHSNLSYDGCELADDACGPRSGSGAGDFFERAADADLDFVALTDHAEWGRYYPAGLDGDSVDVWEEQQRLVQLADAVEGGPLPVLGYEWTNWRERPVDTTTDYEGGHKTVLFEETTVPADFRIGAGRVSDTLVKGDGIYTRSEGPQTPDPIELYALLDDAAAKHGDTPIVSFYHHPACEAPQGVDFGNHDNAPNPRYETLVEIYSEHGNSECIDLDDEDCDWMINHGAVTYLPRGSIQYALKTGYHLGFTAGTDSHDALPGSWQDGPGMHATAGAGYPEPSEQFAPGGLTGAMVACGLTRRHLFAALSERATVATSGPRPALRVLGVDDQGRPWLPGAVVTSGADSLRLMATIAAEGYDVDHISVVNQTGSTVARVEGATLDATVDLEPGGAWYLRIVFAPVDELAGGDDEGGADEGGADDDGSDDDGSDDDGGDGEDHSGGDGEDHSDGDDAEDHDGGDDAGSDVDDGQQIDDDTAAASAVAHRVWVSPFFTGT